MRNAVLFACCLAGLVAGSNVTAAQAQGASGELRCTVAGGLGFVVGGDRGLTCVYYRPDGVTEFYTGTSSRVGIDFAATNPVRVAYKVGGVDPTAPAALDGAFGGPGVGVTIGSGIGGDALIGGRSGTAILVPARNVSLTGIDVSAGLSVLTLHYAGRETLRERRRRY